MDLFPTWQIWQLIHENIEQTQRLIWQKIVGAAHAPNPISPLSNIWIWVIFSFVLSVLASTGGRFLLFSAVASPTLLSLLRLTSLALPLLVLVVSLRYGLRLINTVTKQYEGGIYDLFALLPEGELGNLMNMARVYRHPQQGRIVGVLTFGVLFAIVLFASFYSPDQLFNSAYLWHFDSTTGNPAAIMLRGFVNFVAYLQSFVMALLLALLILQRTQRHEPRIWFIVGFLVLQGGLFFVGSWLSELMADYLQTTTYRVIGIEILFVTLSPYLISQSVILTLCRELINVALWQTVKRRLEA